MISSIKTPGVYIHEVNGFPPSIAQVATAIPAFVGYTEFTQPEPTKVRSLLEYEQLFGGSPEPEDITIDMSTETYQVAESKFKLYNSLRLFFANGGGACYIVSIGDYKTATPFSSATPFNNGIDLLEKVDEVTLLLFPDAVNLGATNLGLVQKHALAQCNLLKDRFTIMDVIQGLNIDDDFKDFRNETGNQYLKYGAAYYPYLKTSFGYKYRYKSIEKGGVNFKSLYSANETVSTAIEDFDTLYEDINKDTSGLIDSWEDIKTNNKKTSITNDASVKNYTDKLWNLLAVVGDINNLFGHSGLIKLLESVIDSTLKPYAQKLVNFRAIFNDLEVLNADEDGADGLEISLGLDDAKFKGINGYHASSPNPYDNGTISAIVEDTQDPERFSPFDTPDYAKIQSQLDTLHNQITAAINALIASVSEYELKTENDLTTLIPIYSKILAGLGNNMNTVPPSGAIAGVYANVDANRGVWKAPANVSVNGIIGLTDDITDKEQEEMNIHESGKSINAIRKFTGKGLLVWGARTLDGNSNDWRYVNVRRLANMIEESTKKACMNFVFEPNVKQTWVNVKGMIENYLTTLWRDGALAGAKAEDAFFVSVGLNETMSATDINEGRMIVKIGYAPSRPAEFIILEFVQTQQKS